MELNEEKMFRRHKKLIDGIMGNNRLIVFPAINRTGLTKKKKKEEEEKVRELKKLDLNLDVLKT